MEDACSTGSTSVRNPPLRGISRADVGRSRARLIIALAAGSRLSGAMLSQLRKTSAKTTPTTATPSRAATRAASSLTPDAIPVCESGTELTAVLVRGGTVNARPSPKTTTPGST